MPGHPPAAERHRRHLPGERLRRGGDADVDDPLAADPAPSTSPSSSRSPARSSNCRRLTEPRRSRTPSRRDLADPAGADEHPPALDGDDEPVHPRRPAAEVDHDVDDMADVGAVGGEQRQPGDPRDIDDPALHRTYRRRASGLLRAQPAPLSLRFASGPRGGVRAAPGCLSCRCHLTAGVPGSRARGLSPVAAGGAALARAAWVWRAAPPRPLRRGSGWQR